MHFLHSLGSIPASRYFTGGQYCCQLNQNTVRILPGPLLLWPLGQAYGEMQIDETLDKSIANFAEHNRFVAF